jgi:hypothetical protein
MRLMIMMLNMTVTLHLHILCHILMLLGKVLVIFMTCFFRYFEDILLTVALLLSKMAQLIVTILILDVLLKVGGR